MKKIGTFLAVAALAGFCAQGANAEVTSLTAKFAGGCKAANTGTCTIRATAEGTSLGGDGVVLQRAETSKGSYRYVSKTNRSLTDAGRATFKFRNKAGCYRVVTTPNGNDAPDVRSRAICEK